MNRSPRRRPGLSTLAAITAIAVLTAAPAASQQQGPHAPGSQSIVVTRVASPPILDEVAKGVPPEGMVAVSEFWQREPGDGVPASRATTAYLGYDAEKFYAVFVCKEEPARVRANMAKRESIMGDDVVGLLIDTFHDRRRAYEFIINPLGIQLDGVASEGQDDDFSFDTVWHSEGRLTPDGFVALLAIPFRSLRFPETPAQTWGIMLARNIPLNNEMSFWPYVTRRINGMGEQMATMTGLEHISPGRNLQFIPYAAFTGSRYLDEGAPAFGTRREGRGGLDAKMIVNDALTVDLTVNPDFSQVESDEPQATINQRFEVFFPEKRPFFIENASMFTTPEQLFFSRRVADPRAGARLTGKAGKWTLAGLVMDDRARGERYEASDPLHGQGATVAVARVQRDIRGKSNIGLFASAYDFGPISNTVVAADTRLQISPNWVFAGQVTRTGTTAADGTRRSGTGVNATLDYGSRSLGWEFDYVDRSPHLRSEVGYIPRTDMRRIESGGRYRWFPKKRRVLSFGPSGGMMALWDHDGELQDWGGGVEFDVELPAGTQIEVEAGRSYERFEGLDFRQRELRVGFETAFLRWLTIDCSVETGTAVNYYPSAGLAPFLSDKTDAYLGLTIRPSSRFRLEETYIFNQLRTRKDWTGHAADRPRDIFNLHLVRTKANYQFSRELSLRAIVDYNAVLPNETLVGLERDKRLSADLLLTYLLNPGTALHVGYSDLYANLELDRQDTVRLRRIGGPTGGAGRQFFVKMSYLLRVLKSTPLPRSGRDNGPGEGHDDRAPAGHGADRLQRGVRVRAQVRPGVCRQLRRLAPRRPRRRGLRGVELGRRHLRGHAATHQGGGGGRGRRAARPARSRRPRPSACRRRSRCSPATPSSRSCATHASTTSTSSSWGRTGGARSRTR